MDCTRLSGGSTLAERLMTSDLVSDSTRPPT